MKLSQIIEASQHMIDEYGDLTVKVISEFDGEASYVQEDFQFGYLNSKRDSEEPLEFAAILTCDLPDFKMRPQLTVVRDQ